MCSQSTSMISGGIWRNIFLIFTIFCAINQVNALFEDQVGRWDWLQRHVGSVKFINYGTNPGSGNLIVGTESNVLAAINSRNGDVTWRKVLEEDERGDIVALSQRGNPVIVTGRKAPLIRSFLASGALEWQIKLPYVPPNSQDVQDTQHYIDSDERRVVSIYRFAQHFVISEFSYASSRAKTSPNIAAPFLANGGAQCELVGNAFFTCLHNNDLHIVSIAHNSQQFVTTKVSTLGINDETLELRILPEGHAVVLAGARSQYIIEINDDGPKMIKKVSAALAVSSFKSNGGVYYVVLHTKQSGCIGTNVIDSQLQNVNELSGEICIPDDFGTMEKIFIMPFIRKDSNICYRTIVVTEDKGVMMFQREGRLIWSREESLSLVKNAHFIDLPLSEGDALIEEEFTEEQKTNILTMFVKRVTSQLQQLISFFDVTNPLSNNFGLVRDQFGFHKVILLATQPGKLFLLDNLSGEILWSKYVPEMRPFKNGQYIIVQQRSTAHLPHQPVSTVVGMHRDGGVYIISLNPISGKILDDRHLDVSLTQYALLQPNQDFLKPILIFDEAKQKTVIYPATADIEYQHYLVSAQKQGLVKGYLLESGKVNLLWSVRLAAGAVVETVSAKHPSEKVYSPGRALGDRSVLYKYVNPNLIAIGAYGELQSTVYVYLIDAVTGSMIYQSAHRKAKGPVHLVHTENWLVYTFMNDKFRRQEISAIDLYQGLQQPNETFSSFDFIQPTVTHSTFILPDHIVHLKDTVTEKGITSKHVLAANVQGSILEIPKAMLDPRRPVTPDATHREEGLIPYIPEILVPTQNILNYNQTISRLRAIETAPSGLESTCLVLAFGLDIYYTRIAPSQNFDILKDNFEHMLICAVLLGLIIASYITKALAARKALNSMWK